ncbi:MAG: leucine-rich repeat domain-containing protein [Clostridiales bacterium]|nr:leucine-rich repeat domain-containing protein [Clostridiales bacterium]
MIKTIISLLTAVMLLSVPAAPQAFADEPGDSAEVGLSAVENYTYGDLTYEINDDDTITIVDCNESVTSLEIPSEIDDKSVTSISSTALSKCSSLTNIAIPSSIKSIANNAFNNCKSLTEINVAISNTVYSSVEGVLFNKDRTYLIKYPAGRTAETYAIPNGVINIGSSAFQECADLTSVIIPGSTTYIGDYAFRQCTGLESINLPGGMISIGSYAFYYCTGLKEIVIPDSVTSIGNSAFSSCSGMESAVISSGITEIEDYTFSGCGNLTSIEIPEGIASIGKFAFQSCNGLTSITIPKNVTSIDYGAFSACSSLASIDTDSENPAYLSDNGVLMNIDKTQIVAYPAGRTEESYIIPNCVTNIGNRAFYKCTGLTSITIPGSVTEIEEGAFYSCRNLEIVYYGGSATKWSSIIIGDFNSPLEVADVKFNIGTYTYDDLKYFINDNNTITVTDYTGSAEIVEIPSEIGSISVTVVGVSAFEQSSVTSVTIPDSVTSISDFAFRNCGSLTSVTLPESLESIGECAFSESGLTSVSIPSGVESIGTHAFGGCSGLTSAVLSEGVTSINDEAFSGCESLESITIASTVTSIGANAFAGCEKLTSIELSDSLESIGSYAFADCSSLTEINIPGNVTSIGDYAFNYCNSLTGIDVDGANPAYMSDGGVLLNKEKTYLIKYPPRRVAERYIIPSSVTEIDAGAFRDSSGLKSIAIPRGVTAIDEYTFSGCTGLESVSIPYSVGVINNQAFFGCSGITDIYYYGTENDWHSVIIGSDNGTIREANVHYILTASDITVDSGTINVTTDIEKLEADKKENSMVYAALYDQNDMLLDCFAAEYNGGDITGTLINNENADHIKIFVWSKDENIQPMTDLPEYINL